MARQQACETHFSPAGLEGRRVEESKGRKDRREEKGKWGGVGGLHGVSPFRIREGEEGCLGQRLGVSGFLDHPHTDSNIVHQLCE